nr:Chain A, Distinctin chain A [synthetic construct]1XKM_C Chain C, Distinctin chain A [synthetic construct]
ENREVPPGFTALIKTLRKCKII